MARLPKARRKMRHVYRGASLELECLLLALSAAARSGRLLAIPTSYPYCRRQGISRTRLLAAVRALLGDGHMRLAARYYGSSAGYGIPNRYEPTWAFKAAFRFKVPRQRPVTSVELTRAIDIYPYHNIEKVDTIPALLVYFGLLDEAVLSLSNGLQVRPHADICRVDGLRLYAYGTYNYQNDIDKEWRRSLLIDGGSTSELDFPAMHANLVLNWEGLPSDRAVYETVMRKLKGRPSKAKRSAVKSAMLAAFNAKDFGDFRKACDDSRQGKSISKVAGSTPQVLLDAMLAAYPAFKKYLFSAGLWRRLQKLDSDIMVDILSALADMGIVALPLHDSVIVQSRHSDTARQVMRSCYRAHTSFGIQVR